MIISIAQARQYAQAAGFTGSALDTIVAIAQAESGLDTTIVNPADANGGSYGIVQINGVHIFQTHAITMAQAFDPLAAFRFAYQLSDGGTKFTDWTTYNHDTYKTTQAWKQSASGTSGTQAADDAAKSAQHAILWGPAQSLKAWPWITSDGVTPDKINNPYMSSFEASRGSTQPGVGVATPFHTVITSLTSGHVIRAFYGTDINPGYTYGGVVLVGSNIPGHPGVQAVFYLHLDELSVKTGDTVSVGQQLGLSGGQNTGGTHPVSPTFSTGPHTDVGVNNPNFAAEGGTPGPNFDPTPWLNDLIKNGPPAVDQVAALASANNLQKVADNAAWLQAVSNQLASGTGPVGDDFATIESRIDAALQFVPIDWQTITASVKWWQIALPWQWGQAADQVETNVANAVAHDIAAFMLRWTIVLIGVILLIAVIFNVASSAAKATGADQVAAQAVKLAPLAVGGA